MKQRSLADGIRWPFRMISPVLAVAFVLTVGVGWYVVGHVQPRLESTIALARQVRLSHEAMLDQETGLRGWLATGNRSFLAPYLRGSASSAATSRALEDAINTDVGGADVVRLRFAQETWRAGRCPPPAWTLRSCRRRRGGDAERRPTPVRRVPGRRDCDRRTPHR